MIPKDIITRRGAMGKILKVVALSAGISVSQLITILSAKAGTITSRSVSKVNESALTKLKMLKVKLSGYNKNVFHSEFGRATPLKPANQIRMPGFDRGMMGMGCSVHSFAGVSGANQASACPSFTICTSNMDSNCPSLLGCRRNQCDDQDYGGDGDGSCTANDCSNQDCSSLTSCNGNDCTDQNCPNLTVCDRAASIADLTNLLNRFKTDQYVQDLMGYFRVTNTRQLAQQVNTMIRQKRALTPAQLHRGSVQRQTTPNVRPKTY